MGAFMMNGLIPGPFLFKEHADFVWAVIASLYIGNVILLILNLPLIPMWVAILKIPYSILFAADPRLLRDRRLQPGQQRLRRGRRCWPSGIVGYVFKKLDIPLAPMVLTLILGPLMERGLRQSLEISRGDFTIFFTRPISAVLLAIGAIFIVTATMRVAGAVRGADTQL